MTATKLRYVLFGLIVVLLGGFGAGAWWVHGLLGDRVRQTDHAIIDADVSAAELQQLRSLEQQLIEDADAIERAKQIAASTEQYRYQDQVISDIADYAARYGIQISTFDFSAASATKSTQTVDGARLTPFTVTLKGPLPYTTFLRFIQDVEKNLTKIQVTSMTLSPDVDPNNITNPNLGLAVYIRG